VRGLDTGVALDWLAIGEESHRVVSFKRNHRMGIGAHEFFGHSCHSEIDSHHKAYQRREDRRDEMLHA
jgi:hypothetical protein